MSTIRELVIVGAGPAGMQAAIAAASAGVQVILIDSSPLPGGQYYKQLPRPFLSDNQDSHHEHAHQLFSHLANPHIEVMTETMVWGIFAGANAGTWQVATYGPTGCFGLETKKIILANGAYDRSISFPGWDLPGVITAGAALTMLKHQHFLPGKRILLSGSGPLQMAAAAWLIDSGAEVVAVLESSPNLIKHGIRYLPALTAQTARIREGLGYLRSFIKAKTNYKFGWSITSCSGAGQVQQATFAKLDSRGLPIPGTKETKEVDTVVLGYSLNPNTSLSRMVPCEMEFQHLRGGFVPRRNENFETSQPGIYAAGDCAGVGGAPLSEVEGRITGSAIAHQLGYLSIQEYDAIREKEAGSLAREKRFADVLGDLFSFTPDLSSMAGATIICRCEQISLAEIRAAIAMGAQTVTDIKNITRSGMGNCQGRTCATLIAGILAKETQRPIQAGGFLATRPPIHPVPLSALENYQYHEDSSVQVQRGSLE